MSVRDALTVARHDFLSARRSRLVWGVIAIYVAFVTLVFYGGSTVSDPSVNQTLYTQVALTALLLPLVAVAGSYLAIAGERESNTIRFLLSQPVSRRAVVVGKLLSRAALLTVALVVAVGVGVGVVALTYPALELGSIAKFFALTLLLVAVYVSVAVAISAAASSRSRAISGAIGFYFVSDVLFLFGDLSVVGLLRYVLEDLLGGEYHRFFYESFRTLSPANAYINSTLAIFDPANFRGIPSREALPFYLETEFMLLILAAWTVVPLLVGTVVFDRSELG
ncbi:MAG: ABC transporter permease subunit [Halobacteriaceae archaeon]